MPVDRLISRDRGLGPEVIAKSQQVHKALVENFYKFIADLGDYRLYNRDFVQDLREYRAKFGEFMILNSDPAIGPVSPTDELKLADKDRKKLVAFRPPKEWDTTYAACKAGLGLRFRNYFFLSQPDIENEMEYKLLTEWNDQNTIRKVYLPAMIMRNTIGAKLEDSESIKSATMEELQEMITKVRTEWTNSRSCEELVAAIKRAKSMRRIKRIVCAGLESFTPKNWSESSLSAYCMVLTIASALKDANKNDGDIEILSESTEYRSRDVEYTRSREWAAHLNDETKDKFESKIGLPIKILKDLEAISLIDENTLVFCNPSDAGFNKSQDRGTPVCDILADSHEESKWPAAIFGPIVYEDQKKAEKYQWHKSLETPRVVKMLKGYEKQEFGDIKLQASEMEATGCLLWYMGFYFKPEVEK